MSRTCNIIIFSLFFISVSVSILADDDAEVKKIKEVLNGEEEAEWAGNVEKIKSYFSSDAFMCIISREKVFDRDYGEISDPVHYEIAGYGAQDIDSYAENFRTKPQYLKKNPGFQHYNVVEHVHVKGAMAIAVEKRVRSWTVQGADKDDKEHVRHIIRNMWTLKKISGTWKITGCFAGFAGGIRSWNMRPPQ